MQCSHLTLATANLTGVHRAFGGYPGFAVVLWAHRLKITRNKESVTGAPEPSGQDTTGKHMLFTFSFFF